MTGSPSQTDLLQALGGLVRGLSALFWGLPMVLIVHIQTARMDWPGRLGFFAFVPAAAASALLCHGLRRMSGFRPEERQWRRALDRAEMLAWINLSLSPFLHWWHRVPDMAYFLGAVLVLAASSVLLLYQLNRVLYWLTAMLPDDALRAETGLFTSFNRLLLAAIPMLLAAYHALHSWAGLPPVIALWLAHLEWHGPWLMLFLALIPVAMTMALIWKIKEVLFESLLEAARPSAKQR